MLTLNFLNRKIHVKHSCSIHNEKSLVYKLKTKNGEGGIMANEKKEKKRGSIVKRMIIAVIAGFVVGFLCLVLREFLNGNGNEGVWNIVDAIFFQDITATDGFEGLGLLILSGSFL